MPLPPERISVKRRRQEEPVDTLILEEGTSRDSKRHFTEFIFQRLRHDSGGVVTNKSPRAVTNDEDAARHDRSLYGIPAIKSTVPGDEVRDFAKYRASQAGEQTIDARATDVAKLDGIKFTRNCFIQQAKQARRFHLTRDISILKPNASGGIRRRKLDIRPPLATFVERHQAQHVSSQGFGDSFTPQDRIVHVKTNPAVPITEQKLAPDSIIDKKDVDVFVKPKLLQTKLGRSIRDDPSTWDHESDQLADELSKLAFEMDPDSAQWESDAESEPETNSIISSPQGVEPQVQQTAMVHDDEYIFETYIRIRHDNGFKRENMGLATDFGVLVIDDEDEDLWDKYVQSDGEDDWDEDDGDSNAEDNPRNDYPEDEVSTDDEYGHNVYQYRRDVSDGDDFDD